MSNPYDPRVARAPFALPYGPVGGGIPRYTMTDHLLDRCDPAARRLAYAATTPAEHAAWRDELRATLRTLLGYDRLQRAPLEPVIMDAVRCEGFTRQRVEIQTEPGVWMPLFVLIPDGDGPFPAVMAPHGHCSDGKRAVAGLRDAAWITAMIDDHDYDYGVQLARAGCIAFCPDARGFGERLEERYRGDDRDVNSCLMLQMMAIPLGLTLPGMWAWDLHRLIDYIETRPDCRPGGVGCAGLSGGGLQTLWAAALDDRITCAVISGYFYGMKDALLRAICCACNYVPDLFTYVDTGDLGALIAPRPLLVETGDVDPLNGTNDGLANVTAQVAITRRAYALLDAEDRLTHAICPGAHKWYGTGIPWLQRWLR
jgi:dienelactone hydrolase